MKKTKMIFSALSLFGLLAFVPAHAQVSVGNDTTGAKSENKAELEVKSNFEIKVSNDVSASNNLNLYLSTGNNQASYNTGNGSVSTGDISAKSSIDNSIGTSSVDSTNIGGIGGFDSKVTLANSNTGYNSENKASAEIKNKSNVLVKNRTDIDNKCSAIAKTGNNTASYNTGNGTISTGGIDFECNISNEIGEVNGSGGGSNPPPVIPPCDECGGIGGGIFSPIGGGIEASDNGIGGGSFEFPEELPRAGQGLLEMIGLTLLAGGIALGSRKLALKYFGA